MEAIVQLVVLLGKLAELLVALQQEILHFLRVCCVHNAALLYRERLDSSSTKRKVSQGGWTLNGSCSAGSRFRRTRRIITPQDQRVFNWTGVVVPAGARNVEA